MEDEVNMVDTLPIIPAKESIVEVQTAFMNGRENQHEGYTVKEEQVWLHLDVSGEVSKRPEHIGETCHCHMASLKHSNVFPHSIFHSPVDPAPLHVLVETIHTALCRRLRGWRRRAIIIFVELLNGMPDALPVARFVAVDIFEAERAKRLEQLIFLS